MVYEASTSTEDTMYGRISTMKTMAGYLLTLLIRIPILKEIILVDTTAN